MESSNIADQVRQLCAAAELPVSETELDDLVDRYAMLSEGIERLSLHIAPSDPPVITFRVRDT